MKLIHKGPHLLPAFFLTISLALYLFSGCTPDKSADLKEKMDELLFSIEKYQYGDDRIWLQDFQELMKNVYDSPEIYGAVEQKMIKLLMSDASPEGKLLVCQYLGTIATGASVPVLEKMIYDSSTSEMARIVLERIPDASVDDVLRKALTATGGKTKAGIINSLATRNDLNSIELIGQSMADPDHVVVMSAINALGAIGGNKALDILEDAYAGSSNDLKFEVADALMKCANKLEDKDRALHVYRKVYDSDAPISLRYEAVDGMLKLEEGDKTALLLDVLQSDEYEMQKAIIPLVRDLSSSASVVPFLPYIKTLPDDISLQLLLAIADRNDVNARPIALQYLKSDDQEMRMAGLIALSRIGTAEDVSLIALAAAQSKGREKDLARNCLNLLQGEGINEEVLKALKGSAGTIKSELIRSVGHRKMIEGRNVVMEELNNNDPDVRNAAIKTIGMISYPEDLSRVIDLTMTRLNDSNLNEIIQSITNIAYKIPDSVIRVNEIAAKISEIDDPVAIAALVQVIGNLGDQEALKVIGEYLGSEDKTIKLACVKALSNWPDASPMDYLQPLVEQSEDPRIHTLALKGYVQSVLKSVELSQHDKAAIFKETYRYTINNNEKTMVITGLSRVESLDALKTTIDLLGTEVENQTEVEQAIMQIAGNLKERFPEEVNAEMIRAGELSENPDFKAKVQLLLKSME